ncbi:BadF/BadG/BcrA/BcrD ATPase family protein [uncultured Hoeflea sp.]|uniref:BadF/BadG/BcrA/BcrD ATPase family protein n=1 Tax=uncultured Hoeflea sp. TaxID=538666 RepID=UPI0030DC2778
MTEWVGAVDGGGSKTATALLSSEGELIRLPSANGCNPLDNPAWSNVLAQVMTQITESRDDVGVVTMGMPGFGEIADFDHAVSQTIVDLLADRALVLNDVEMAFHGAFPDGQGILLLAGTGSMAIGGGPLGLVRVGGWGNHFGDEGSAHWIGRSALSLASREIDGRLAQTGFAAELCAEMDLDPSKNALAFMGWIAGQSHARSAIAALSQIVDRLARRGNPTARSLLEDAGRLLVEHLDAAGNLAGLGPDTAWSAVGSVFESDTVITSVRTMTDRSPVSAQLPPLGGGLLLAARKAGWPTDQPFIEKLARQLTPSLRQRNTS